MTNLERSPALKGHGTGSGDWLAVTPGTENELSELGPRPEAGAIILGGTQGSLSVARSLGRRGIRVWLVETSRSVAGFSRYVEKRIAWAGPEAPEAADWLISLADRHGLGRWVVYVAADAETRFVAENHARLASRFRLITLPWDVLRQLQDKSLLYKRAADLGLAYPRSYVPDSEAGNGPTPDRFPVIIKPTTRETNNALTTAKAWRADDREQYLRLYGEARRLLPAEDIVVQEMIPGGGEAQFSYTGLWHEGTEVASMPARRTRQFTLSFGTGTFVETIDKPEIEKVARRLLESLGYHGLVEAEFKFDARDGEYKVLDVNTRVWTWIGLGAEAGVDFPWLAWQMATGDVPAPARGRAGASWRYLSRDILAELLEIRAGTMTLAGFLKSFGRRSAHAIFAGDDPLPALVDIPLIARRLIRRLLGRH